MVHIAADLPQFLQRRELAAYEQRLARTAYAYGVDLRRSAWLAGSTIGDPLIRAVDRRWNRTVKALEETALRPLRKAPPTALLEQLARLIHMLRAPLPTLRVLRPEVARQWPMITPLGTTKGGIHWLVLDLERVTALTENGRAFALGAALGHLQCDHGPIFAAHLMAHRGARGMGLIRRLLWPWSKVAVFSADRAGLVACRSLETALEAVDDAASAVPWMPRGPGLEARRQALQDFDRSALMTRVRLLGDDERQRWSVAPPGREEEIDSLTRKMAAAFGSAVRLGDMISARLEGRYSVGNDDADAEAKPDEQQPAQDPRSEASAGSDEADPKDPSPDDARSDGSVADPQESDATSARDSEQHARLEHALRDAWTLARCDQRLTRRLGLL